MAGKLSAEDRLDVQDLIASYAHCLDTVDFDGLAGLFLPDGVLEHRAGKQEGRESIRAWGAMLHEQARLGPASRSKHFVGTPIIVEGDSERCRVRSYSIIPMVRPTGEIAINMSATYRDDCVKVDGRWYFEKRLIDLDMNASPEVLGRS